MKIFKNPVFAVFLAIVVVIASTLINVNVKFGRKCDAVNDQFYEGVSAGGYKRPAIASHLENISGAADGLIAIANNYGLDGSAVTDASDALKSSLRYENGASYVHFCYSELMQALTELLDGLDRSSLSERDASGVEQYRSTIGGAQSAISEAQYNEAVRSFLRRYDHFPTNVLARLAGVEMPETFA